MRSQYVNYAGRVWGIAVFIFTLLLGCQDAGDNVNKKEPRSLAEAYEGQFKIGVALNSWQIEGKIPEAKPLITTHFNSITPENLLKWESVHPRPDEYNFAPADSFVKLGEQQNMFIVGHTLVWHSQVPDWVFEEATREELLQRMESHISQVVGRFKGRIDAWDVVNEAVLDEGGMRNSKWYELVGEDYVEKAFQYAHKVDPDAELYYNDYNLWKPAKRKAAIQLVERLQSNDIPIHGIGMQAHLGIDNPPIEQVEESIQAFSELDIKVMITELDIDLLPDEDDVEVQNDLEDGDVPPALNPYTESLPDSVQQKLTERYVALFKLFKKHQDKIDRITFWGLNDGQSWLNNFPIPGRTNYPLLFDRNYQPKSAFHAVIDVADE